VNWSHSASGMPAGEWSVRQAWLFDNAYAFFFGH
jgi:hypothetical protein